jgi:hypothetical protein
MNDHAQVSEEQLHRTVEWLKNTGQTTDDVDRARAERAVKGKSSFRCTFADDLGDEVDEADELIERLLTSGAMSVIYGDSNSGKTFLGIDIGAAVARGITWMDRKVEPGMVVYLASESPASVRRRLRAYQRHHEVKIPNFAIIEDPVDLCGPVDTARLIKQVRALEKLRGVKCRLIIGDTLSRLTAGANENSAEDMSLVVQNSDRIRDQCAAHFMLIHHTGKNTANGMRGWSGMRAAIDTEIEVVDFSELGTHSAEITKQRDIPGKGDRIGFRLQVVEMGVSKWGKPVTSCVVIGEVAPKKQTGKRPSEIAGAVIEVLTSRGSGMRKAEMVKHLEDRYRRTSVYRELSKMAEEGLIVEIVGVIGLVRDSVRGMSPTVPP